jgi:hypothetical protein
MLMACTTLRFDSLDNAVGAAWCKSYRTIIHICANGSQQVQDTTIPTSVGNHELVGNTV